MPEYLRDEGMAEGVDTIGDHTFTKERQPQAVSELSYHQPNQPSQQDHAASYPHQLKAKAEKLLTDCAQPLQPPLSTGRLSISCVGVWLVWSRLVSRWGS